MAKKLLIAAVNLILYGNFWIALGAASMAGHTALLLNKSFPWQDSYIWFIFSATLALYAAHRLIGFILIQQDINIERSKVIRKFKSHILFYCIGGSISALILYNYLSANLQLLLLLPTALAFFYITPIVNRKRLRDIPFIKVFVISIVWVWLTITIPMIEQHIEFNHWQIVTCSLEKLFFLVAITIPFDIRDMSIDRNNEVITLATHYGATKAKTYALISIACAIIFVFINILMKIYNWELAIAIVVSYATSTILIYLGREGRHDYYFSGLLDGMLVLQSLLIVLLS